MPPAKPGTSLVESYLRAVTHQLSALSKTNPTEEDWMQRVKLLNTVTSIIDVAEIGRDKHPELCTTLLRDGNSTYEQFSSVATPQCRSRHQAFAKELEDACDAVSARTLQQHYKFLQRFDELAVAACLMNDQVTMDNLTIKLGNMKTTLHNIEHTVDRRHWQVVWDGTCAAFQMAVDASLALGASAQAAGLATEMALKEDA
eukprot:NODE_331_length_1467_cov_872.569111_g242_i0.p2 GENE.NODE_331_length_1467_cov_872.569111_g242_i0~~NODE_331_length_1467_cov_872.569111_g242_i0.p2  ORF type:complete len:201 (-),score=39.14 NODE_331_length_1467_cov_872.569111_g242_i0:791-1393(-)